jgi:hypothetical protein
MKKTAVILFGIGLLVASFMLGMYVADKHVIWGNVDLLSKKENKVIKLKETITFTDSEGKAVTLEKGTVLNWEGFYHFQNFLSQRYIIEGFNDFEVIKDAGPTGVYYMSKQNDIEK